jgi:hypothetical protein
MAKPRKNAAKGEKKPRTAKKPAVGDLSPREADAVKGGGGVHEILILGAKPKR